MADYISKKCIYDIIYKHQKGLQNMGAILMLDTIDKEVQKVPAVDVQPVKHGRWIDCTFYDPCEKSYEQNYEFKCSNCGHMIYNKPNDDNQYCGHCGARMDGDTK